MSLYGRIGGAAGEARAYGHVAARAIVIGLIVDDGLPARMDREALFNPLFRLVGVAAGAHPIYGSACVVDFAASFEEPAP